jgi:hypothetical protein
VADFPPPSLGTPGVPTPPEGPPRRTPLVTAAGGMLITIGVLFFFGGAIILIAGSDGALVNGKEVNAAEGVARIVTGVLDVMAGLLILWLRPIGRLAGFVLAGVTIVFGVLDLVRGDGRGILPLIFGGLVIWALVVLEPTFRRASRR